MENKNTFDWLEIAKKLQAIAQAGLEFGHSEFDIDRYEQLRQISIDILDHHTSYDATQIREFFATDKGYPTPKVDVRAAIFQDDKILMVREKCDGRWSLPGGWADQHLTIKENLIKEAGEEAGVDIEPQKILAIFDRKLHNQPPIPYGCYKIFVECKLNGGGFKKNIETTGSEFFSLNNLPPLSPGRNSLDQIEYCFSARHNENNVLFE